MISGHSLGEFYALTAVGALSFKDGLNLIYALVHAKENQLKQLSSPVRWMQCVTNMINDGMIEFVVCGPSYVLIGLIDRMQNEFAGNDSNKRDY